MIEMRTMDQATEVVEETSRRRVRNFSRSITLGTVIMILVITCIIVIVIIIIVTLIQSQAIKKVQDEIPQKSKNGINHGLPNPNNASDLSDHPFRIHPVAEIITESTTKISYINNDTVGNTTIRNYSTVT